MSIGVEREIAGREFAAFPVRRDSFRAKPDSTVSISTNPTILSILVTIPQFRQILIVSSKTFRARRKLHFSFMFHFFFINRSLCGCSISRYAVFAFDYISDPSHLLPRLLVSCPTILLFACRSPAKNKYHSLLN